MFEAIDWNAFYLVILLPVARAIGGWFLNASEDGVFTQFEVKALWDTIVRLGWIPFLAFIGFDVLAGLDVAIWVSLFMVVIDWARSMFKKTIVEVVQ